LLIKFCCRTNWKHSLLPICGKLTRALLAHQIFSVQFVGQPQKFRKALWKLHLTEFLVDKDTCLTIPILVIIILSAVVHCQYMWITVFLNHNFSSKRQHFRFGMFISHIKKEKPLIRLSIHVRGNETNPPFNFVMKWERIWWFFLIKFQITRPRNYSDSSIHITRLKCILKTFWNSNWPFHFVYSLNRSL
jgi:hypothetical protein